MAAVKLRSRHKRHLLFTRLAPQVGVETDGDESAYHLTLLPQAPNGSRTRSAARALTV